MSRKSDVIAASSSSRLSTSSTGSFERENKRTKKGSSSSAPDEKQELLPLHVINRTTSCHVKASNPGHCLEMLDRMYNIYYEIEVNSNHVLAYRQCFSVPFNKSSFVIYQLLLRRINLVLNRICRGKRTSIRR